MSEQRDDQVVHEFEAGRHTFRASVSSFRGAARIDLREWYEPEPGKPLAPTKKGINLPAEYVVELREAVEALATGERVTIASRDAPAAHDVPVSAHCRKLSTHWACRGFCKAPHGPKRQACECRCHARQAARW